MIILTLCLREALFCYPKFDSKDIVPVVFQSWKTLLILLDRQAITQLPQWLQLWGYSQSMPQAYDFTRMGQVCSCDW